jgi:hypothetical protein
MDTNQHHYTEQQRFSQGWIWALLVITAGIGGYALYNQKTVAPIGVAIAFVTLGSVAALFGILNLQITVDNDGIHVRFAPFQRHKTIDWSTIVRISPKTLSPLEALVIGYGLRFDIRNSMVYYNVKGRHAIIIETQHRRNIAIGTQQPSELLNAI